MNKGFEQLRVCAAYPKVNLKVVGTHSGISIGEDGPSQMSVEETALACSLVGFVVIAPADEAATKALVRLAAAHVGPVFIRTGRPKAPIVYGAGPEVRNRQGHPGGRRLRCRHHGQRPAGGPGHSLAAETLEAEGISARVIDMHTVKPLDREAIRRAAAETGAIVVAEEHLVDGGLGVRVAQVVAETRRAPWNSWASTIPTPNPASRRSCWRNTAWWPAMSPRAAKYGAQELSGQAWRLATHVRRRVPGRSLHEQSPACHWIVTPPACFTACTAIPQPFSVNRRPS